LSGKKPYIVVIGMFFMFFIVLISYGWSWSRTKVEFSTINKQIIIYIEYPQGTDIEKTNNITKEIEQRVYAVIDSKEYVNEDTKSNYLVESAVSQVGEGAGNPQTDAGSSAEMPHKAKSPFLCKNSSIEKGEILKNETQGPTGPKRHLSWVSISVEKDWASCRLSDKY
jgi:multidrug efflux pump subunit AcrB